LEEGIAFVDTPGLGSLATSRSAETLAYLPRCDLGLLMIDASSGVSVEDLAVVDALHRAGATVMILISKADLFNCAEQAQMIEYVARQIERELRILPPIFAMSVVGESSLLCDNWFKENLQPMLKRTRSWPLQPPVAKLQYSGMRSSRLWRPGLLPAGSLLPARN
jgi:predicted GTPase